ncbi:hypothetical protein EUTSA_v10023136mg [Eutrema salsugineum]|uniref:F-box domain-containing protein n=1 Tax=Eutrema salsugineum TaxID=72664 RepID=V4NV45_EUTSA|nr:hypothetical protein EUTSA_v10023136mg [Eutrema salsugineum]
MHVTNDRQVSSLIALSRVHMVHLCVSSRVEMDTEENQEGSDEDLGEESEENSEHSTDDEADISDVNDDGEDVDDAAYSDGEDYSVYGKVKDEDDGEDEVCIENVRNRYGETGSTPMSWSDNIYVRASFPTKEKLLSEVRLTAIMLKFAFKTQKSTKTLFVAKCRVEGCAWMVRASVKNDASNFWVTKYVKDHTCSIAHRMGQRGKSNPKYIGKLFISHWGIIDGLTPEHVRVSMKHMFSIKMDYTTSYRSLIYAQQLVRGTAEDGYASLPAYLHSVNKANPGTISALHVDSNNKFKYLFLAFGASIAGFQYMRRVIVVDGCHLTGKYEGTLLVATAQDGNFQIFPLAFGIFFSKLRECVSDGYPLVIVYDRHLFIKKACQTIFPWAKRGICYYHLQHNIVTKFRGKQLLYLVKCVAYAYNLYDYNRYMAELRQIKPNLADYLEEADVSLWSRVHFVGDRYNIKTSNVAESINAALKKAHGYPISFLLDFIRDKLGWWFLKRRENALNLTTHNTRRFVEIMQMQWRWTKLTLGDSICISRWDSCGFPCMSDLLKKLLVQGVPTSICLPQDIRREPGRRKKFRWQSWLEISRRKSKKPRKLHKLYSCSQCKKPDHTLPNCTNYSFIPDPLKMSNQINFNSLPSDILCDILLKITSRSYGGLCRARVSSKHLNEISNEEGFLRAADLITLTIPWVWDQHGRVDAFFQRCLECRNPTAQYLRGVSLIFYEDSIQEGFDLIKVSSNGGCLMATYSVVMFSLTIDGSHDVFNHIRGILPAEATKMRKTMQHINRCPTTYKKPDAFHKPVFHVFAKAQSRSCACMNLPNQHWMDDESLVDSYGDKLCSPCFWMLECAIFWKTIPGFANEWPR